MGVLDQKKKVFGNIAAMRTLNDGLPKLKLNSSFPSINTGGNSLDFLTDLLKSLVGYEELRNVVVDILTHNLDTIEKEVKKALKVELKGLVNCGVDPSIPTFLQYGGTGVNVKTKQVDFFDILLVDPSSQMGNLIYDDTAPQLGSTDFNTFLYYTLQNDTVAQDWGSTTMSQDIVNITFNSAGSGSIPNNTLTITASAYYSNPANGKTLTDFNNDYIDSVKLFGSEKVISTILDTLFGSISVQINKTTKQLENEEKLQSIIDCIVNSNEDDVIDDSYFTFNNEQVASQQEKARDRKNGIRKLATCGDMEVSLSSSFLVDIQTGLTASTLVVDKKDVISKGINGIGNELGSFTDREVDKYSIKLNFIQELLNKLIHAIVTLVLSPKIILIFLLNFKILYGNTTSFDDAVDFLKKNKTLIRSVMNDVKNMIIQTLLKVALKEIANMAAETAIKIQTEKAKMQIAKMLSLVGVPQDTIRLIQGLL